MPPEPAWDGYFADPFLLPTDNGTIAYGSSPPFTRDGASVQALHSADLIRWDSIGTVLTLDPAIGTDVWAPEVLHADGTWWMYSSAGFGIHGHHLRVASAADPAGPFHDCGVNLTPDQRFAIDAHPFTDKDGRRYLYYARDVLDAQRPGTHLAVQEMVSPTRLAPEVVPVLAPDADWQVYERDRAMYGGRYDWHTLEGPTVIRRGDTYVLFYSGGSWEGDGYGVSYATAGSPLGPWTNAPGDRPLLLSSSLTGQRGPGHNAVLELPDGTTLIAYHAWDHTGTRRQMHLRPLHWVGHRPTLLPA